MNTTSPASTASHRVWFYLWEWLVQSHWAVLFVQAVGCWCVTGWAMEVNYKANRPAIRCQRLCLVMSSENFSSWGMLVYVYLGECISGYFCKMETWCFWNKWGRLSNNNPQRWHSPRHVLIDDFQGSPPYFSFSLPWLLLPSLLHLATEQILITLLMLSSPLGFKSSEITSDFWGSLALSH